MIPPKISDVTNDEQDPWAAVQAEQRRWGRVSLWGWICFVAAYPVSILAGAAGGGDGVFVALCLFVVGGGGSFAATVVISIAAVRSKPDSIAGKLSAFLVCLMWLAIFWTMFFSETSDRIAKKLMGE